MLEVAHRNLGELGITNVELREADIARLPLSTDSVDAAVANMVLHHAESPEVVLREMTRVTKPGHWVAVTDAVEHTYEWMRTEHADVWLGFREDQVAGFFAAARLAHYGYARWGCSETSSQRRRSTSRTSGSSRRGAKWLASDLAAAPRRLGCTVASRGKT
jgi:ArsR family transcriptional regulator